MRSLVLVLVLVLPLVLVLVLPLVLALAPDPVQVLVSLGPGQMFGTLESPGFPDPYPNQVQQTWILSAPPGFRIQVDFSHFDLEPSHLCQYDFLRMEAGGRSLGLFCGRDPTDSEAVPGRRVFFSPLNQISLQFQSDFSNQETHAGFRAHYSAQDVDECSDPGEEDQLCDHFCHNHIGGFSCSCRHGYRLHADGRTCTVLCGGAVFRQRGGVLSSPDFPGPYPKSSDCWALIRLEAGFRLRLQFDPHFDVEDHPEARCPYDHVQIEAGGRTFGPFCGRRSPGLILTNSSEATVRFHSDDSGENTGWRLTYTATGSSCPTPEAPPNAVMSPVQSEYSFKDHLLFTCEPGYQLFTDGDLGDHLQLDCLANGSWSGNPPRCQKVDCGTPKMAAAADVVFGSHDNSTLLGSSIQYVCREDGATPTAGPYRCGPTGNWTDEEGGTAPPSCPPACGLPVRPPPAQVKRIVGGRSARPGQFPWQVLLSVEDRSRVPEDRWFGAGALLSRSWVLTAAHVLRSRRRDARAVPVAPEHVQVFLGLLRDRSGPPGRAVQTVLLHPDFQPINYNSDIALLRLRDPLDPLDPLDSGSRPVCLPPAPQVGLPSPAPGSLGVVAGWGISNPNASSSPPPLTSDPGGPAEALQFVRLPVVSQEECRASYASRSSAYNITDNMFCAGFPEGGRDTCLGDSGGAFVVQDQATGRWAVVGLVSWGGPEDCGTQRVYGVYTRVGRYLDWIQTQLRSDP